MLPGDYLYVDRNPNAPSPGEIIAFKSVEEAGLTVLKRVVAVGGDTLEMRDGTLRRNGQLVGEPYTVATEAAGLGPNCGAARDLLRPRRQPGRLV